MCSFITSSFGIFFLVNYSVCFNTRLANDIILILVPHVSYLMKKLLTITGYIIFSRLLDLDQKIANLPMNTPCETPC